MKVIPRPADVGFEAHQFTVESREFVARVCLIHTFRPYSRRLICVSFCA